MTGLRGIAALWVVAHHLLCTLSWAPLRHLIEKGYLAVDLFFVLSGFVIALNHGKTFAAGARADLSLAFYRRRVERVYPLLVVAVLLALAFEGASGDPLPSPATLLTNFTMTQAWFSLDSIVGPSWSVSVEVVAYLLFPTIAAFAARRSPIGLACIIVFAWCGLWLVAATGSACARDAHPSGPLDVYRGPFALLRCLCGFVAGVAACRLAYLPRIRARLARRGLAEALIAAILALTWLTDLDLLVAALLVPLVCALSVPEHRASQWLSSTIAVRLGDLSYALYLAHSVVAVPVMATLVGRLPVICIYLTGLAASLAAASLLHELVEKPCRALLRGRRFHTGAATVAAQA